jgi:hypothetical protein
VCLFFLGFLGKSSRRKSPQWTLSGCSELAVWVCGSQVICRGTEIPVWNRAAPVSVSAKKLGMSRCSQWTWIFA